MGALLLPIPTHLGAFLLLHRNYLQMPLPRVGQGTGGVLTEDRSWVWVWVLWVLPALGGEPGTQNRLLGNVFKGLEDRLSEEKLCFLKAQSDQDPFHC